MFFTRQLHQGNKILGPDNFLCSHCFVTQVLRFVLKLPCYDANDNKSKYRNYQILNRIAENCPIEEQNENLN